MSLYYGKNGALRILDSSSGSDLSVTGPKQVHVSNEVSSVHNDITANMLDPDAGTATILAVLTDYVYIGQIFRFSRVEIVLDTPASADGGALVVEYWDGLAWGAVSNLSDGTASGGNTMQVDGAIEFDIPTDWAKNDPPTTGTNLYYIRIRTTSSTGTDTIVEVVEPSSGQYIEVPFSNMDLSGPEGRNRPEEILRLNRAQLDTNASYIQGIDDPIQEPMTLTFSCLMDSNINATGLTLALQGGNAGISESWPLAAVSTKTDTQLAAGLTGTLVNTPPFTDPTKKTVCIQTMWTVDLDVDPTARIFREYNEILVVGQGITLTEAVDGITLAVNAMIYGDIRTDLTRFGYRW